MHYITPITGHHRIPANLVKRLAAYAIDCTLLFGGLLAWQTALYPVNPVVAAMNDDKQPDGRQLHGWVFATGTLPFLLYFAGMQRSTRQATLGQRWLGLKVETVGGKRISAGQALLRCAVMLLPFELNHAVLFHLMPHDGESRTALTLGYVAVWTVIVAYLVAIPLTEHRQSVHDLAAGTVVSQVD